MRETCHHQLDHLRDTLTALAGQVDITMSRATAALLSADVSRRAASSPTKRPSTSTTTDSTTGSSACWLGSNPSPATSAPSSPPCG